MMIFGNVDTLRDKILLNKIWNSKYTMDKKELKFLKIKK